MHKISLLTNICLLIALSPTLADTAACPLDGTPRGKMEVPDPVLQINTSIIEARGNHVLLEINWYVEQDNLAINHEEQFTGPTDRHFVVTVTLKRNGHFRGLPSRKKEFVLRVNPTE